jgi:hypothetical protein
MGSVVLGPQTDLAVRLKQLEATVAALATRDVLQNASIGAGGITVNGGTIRVTNGGSITVDGTGTISLPTGTLSAGNLSIGGNATVAGTVTTQALTVTTTATVGAVSSSGGGAFGATVSSSGNVTASGQVVSAGIINSPGTKSNTVTVGYSAVYIDSSGNMGGNTSSRRFKTNLAPAVYDLDALLALPTWQFQRNTDVLEMGAAAAPWQAGLMAEDVAPVAPLNVWYDDQGLVEGVRYEELVVPLLMAIKRERAERRVHQAWVTQSLNALAAAAGVTLPPLPGA